MDLYRNTTRINCKNNHEQATVYAEQNAISDCAKRGVLFRFNSLYYTLSCINCMKILCRPVLKIWIY